jgi:hypothetical protein
MPPKYNDPFVITFSVSDLASHSKRQPHYTPSSQEVEVPKPGGVTKETKSASHKE